MTKNYILGFHYDNITSKSQQSATKNKDFLSTVFLVFLSAMYVRNLNDTDIIMIKDSIKIHETFHTWDDGELFINGQGIPV